MGMALEAATFPQDSFGYCTKKRYTMGGGPWNHGIGEPEEEGELAAMEREAGNCSGTNRCSAERIGNGESGLSESTQGNWRSFSSSVLKNVKEWDVISSSPEACCVKEAGTVLVSAGEARRKRRRTKSCRNREVVENQRMTHIAVERNRRKQMNEYLSILRSLMPPSYVQRGDQASIVGGAIDFVKELEQLLQTLEAQKLINQKRQQQGQPEAAAAGAGTSFPFSRFFAFPQYSTSAVTRTSPSPPATPIAGAAVSEPAAKNRPAVADIEVTMVESHANLRVLLRRRPRQLLGLVAGLQGLSLAVLHLNVTTTVDQMVLYSFSLKVEEDSKLPSVDEIAAAVHRILTDVQGEAGL